MRSCVTSLIYSHVLSSNVSRAVGEPIIADTSALVDVPGTSSFSESGSTLLPRSYGGGISQAQERQQQAGRSAVRVASADGWHEL